MPPIRRLIDVAGRGLLVAILIAVCQANADTQTGTRRLARPSAPSRRLALVVGNNAYKTAALTNAVNDAKAITQALNEAGFEVTELTDATLRQFERGLDAFARALRPDDMALFYYAGHGLQLEGENYLLPVDYEAGDVADVKYEAYSASRVHDKLAAARLKLLILDACRDNPFVGTRSGARGLAPMSAQGSLIVFATGPGQTASDNPQGRNGLFTHHLLNSLRQPGLSLSELFRTVRLSVHEASGGRQSPWVFDNLIGDVVLREGGPAPAAGGAAPPAEDSATVALRAELALWESIKDSTTTATFDDYLRQFPNGRFSVVARERLNALRAAARPTPRTDEATRPAGPPAVSVPRGEDASVGYEPTVGMPGKDVVWVPTPDPTVIEMLKIAGVGPGDTVYDLGSGDGRIVITAAKHFGARGVGIEYNAQLNALAMRNARQAGVADRVTFRTEDLFTTDLSRATVITMFLLPSINAQLRPKLQRLAPGTRIVTNSFLIEGWQPDNQLTVTENCSSWCTANLYVVRR